MVTATPPSWEALMAGLGPENETQPDNYMGVGTIIGDADNPTRVSDLQFRGYREAWNTRTGQKSLVLKYLQWQVFQERFLDGAKELVFTPVDPHIPPNYGENLFCILNPLAPDHVDVVGMGFQPCRKAHIPHTEARMSHLRLKHKHVYAAIERRRTENERAEDRQLQREALATNNALLAAMAQRVAPMVAVANAPSPRHRRGTAKKGVTNVSP